MGRDSAVVTDQDGVTRLSPTRSGTAVVVVTNLGRPEAIAVAVGCTASPTGACVVQQVRQLAWLLQDGKIRARFLL